MAEELGSLELLRTDFINNFSHEFKTPIVSIKGFAELLREGGLTPEENDEYLDIIIRESSRLSSMATNVLNLSRYENQSILTERTAFPLDEMVRRCVLLLQSAWENKALDMDVELEAITVRGDAEMLSQVWLNLLDNAVKFSPHGGLIAIRLRREGGEAVFPCWITGRASRRKSCPMCLKNSTARRGTRPCPAMGWGWRWPRRSCGCTAAPSPAKANRARGPALRCAFPWTRHNALAGLYPVYAGILCSTGTLKVTKEVPT
jgi:hypothetical protein